MANPQINSGDAVLVVYIPITMLDILDTVGVEFNIVYCYRLY